MWYEQVQYRAAGQLGTARGGLQGTVPLAKLAGENMFGLQPLMVFGSTLDLISSASHGAKISSSKE